MRKFTYTLLSMTIIMSMVILIILMCGNSVEPVIDTEPATTTSEPYTEPTFTTEPSKDTEPTESTSYDCSVSETTRPDENAQSLDGYTYLGQYRLTAYCACVQCCGKSDGITASGVQASEGITVAADTGVLPMNTEIYIDGYGHRVVQDCGGGITGARIDVFFNDHQDALNFGVQVRDVYIRNK